MGCDIHATLEYDKYAKKMQELKRDNRPSWYAFAKSIDVDRSYYLFTLLAGVRDMGLRPVIAADRGLPNDAGYEVKKELEDWDVDAHSTSWVTFKELRDWQPENPEIVEYDPMSFKDDDFYKTMELLAEKYGDENVRLVFFFDN